MQPAERSLHRPDRGTSVIKLQIYCTVTAQHSQAGPRLCARAASVWQRRGARSLPGASGHPSGLDCAAVTLSCQIQ